MNVKHEKIWRWVAVFFGSACVFTVCFLLQQARTGQEAGGGSAPETGSQPQRIISLAPSITEILFALDLGPQVVGVTRYCDYPPEAISKQEVGGYFDPNYEMIVSLEPDLVITLPSHEKIRSYLGERGIQILTVDHGTLEGILESITAIGRVGGKEERTEKLVTNLRERMQSVSGRLAKCARPSVMIAVGRDLASDTIGEVYIAGKSGWYTELIELAGGTNAYGGDLAFPSVSAEGIIKMNPDVIVEMLGDMPSEKLDHEKEMLGWKSVGHVAAVANDRVYIFRDGFVVVPGPRFILTLEKLARVLHPDVDWDVPADGLPQPASSHASEEL